MTCNLSKLYLPSNLQSTNAVNFFELTNARNKKG